MEGPLLLIACGDNGDDKLDKPRPSSSLGILQISGTVQMWLYAQKSPSPDHRWCTSWMIRNRCRTTRLMRKDVERHRLHEKVAQVFQVAPPRSKGIATVGRVCETCVQRRCRCKPCPSRRGFQLPRWPRCVKMADPPRPPPNCVDNCVAGRPCAWQGARTLARSVACRTAAAKRSAVQCVAMGVSVVPISLWWFVCAAGLGLGEGGSTCLCIMWPVHLGTVQLPYGGVPLYAWAVTK